MGHGAHSILVSSNPPSGAKLPTAPTTVQMTFSEGVEPAFSSFIVIDRTRKHFEAGAPTIDRVRGLVTVPLQPNLAPGDYVVQWKVVSVVDGHLTKGSFAFNVQAAPAYPPPCPQRPSQALQVPHLPPNPRSTQDPSLPRPTSLPASLPRRACSTWPCAGWAVSLPRSWPAVPSFACS